MGLVDDIRKKRDSWISRFEEQRQENYGEEYSLSNGHDDHLSEEEIKRNLQMVGKFDKKSTD